MVRETHVCCNFLKIEYNVGYRFGYRYVYSQLVGYRLDYRCVLKIKAEWKKYMWRQWQCDGERNLSLSPVMAKGLALFDF